MSTEKLPIELKTKWVEALRSGKYKQGMGKLRDGDCYCCIGVYACVLGAPITEDGIDMIEEGKPVAYVPLQRYIGEDETFILYRMNDGGKPFSEIASYIESNL